MNVRFPAKPDVTAVFQDVSMDNYLLQTSKDEFFRMWCRGNGLNRRLYLIATDDAPYSTPQLRRLAPSPQYVISAIDYLFNDGHNTPPAHIGRYTPRRVITGMISTFCNIFINDVTRILHCEIPNRADNTSVRFMVQWLNALHGGISQGWCKTTSGVEAQRWANAGGVAVMVRCLHQGCPNIFDHIALVRPNGFDLHGATERYFPLVAQAGSIVSPSIQSTLTFRDLSPIEYYLHD